MKWRYILLILPNNWAEPCRVRSIFSKQISVNRFDGQVRWIDRQNYGSELISWPPGVEDLHKPDQLALFDYDITLSLEIKDM